MEYRRGRRTPNKPSPRKPRSTAAKTGDCGPSQMHAEEKGQAEEATSEKALSSTPRLPMQKQINTPGEESEAPKSCGRSNTSATRSKAKTVAATSGKKTRTPRTPAPSRHGIVPPSCVAKNGDCETAKTGTAASGKKTKTPRTPAPSRHGMTLRSRRTKEKKENVIIDTNSFPISAFPDSENASNSPSAVVTGLSECTEIAESSPLAGALLEKTPIRPRCVTRARQLFPPEETVPNAVIIPSEQDAPSEDALLRKSPKRQASDSLPRRLSNKDILATNSAVLHSTGDIEETTSAPPNEHNRSIYLKPSNDLVNSFGAPEGNKVSNLRARFEKKAQNVVLGATRGIPTKSHFTGSKKLNSVSFPENKGLQDDKLLNRFTPTGEENGAHSQSAVRAKPSTRLVAGLVSRLEKNSVYEQPETEENICFKEHELTSAAQSERAQDNVTVSKPQELYKYPTYEERLAYIEEREKRDALFAIVPRILQDSLAVDYQKLAASWTAAERAPPKPYDGPILWSSNKQYKKYEPYVPTTIATKEAVSIAGSTIGGPENSHQKHPIPTKEAVSTATIAGDGKAEQMEILKEKEKAPPIKSGVRKWRDPLLPKCFPDAPKEPKDPNREIFLPAKGSDSLINQYEAAQKERKERELDKLFQELKEKLDHDDLIRVFKGVLREINGPSSEEDIFSDDDGLQTAEDDVARVDASASEELASKRTDDDIVRSFSKTGNDTIIDCDETSVILTGISPLRDDFQKSQRSDGFSILNNSSMTGDEDPNVSALEYSIKRANEMISKRKNESVSLMSCPKRDSTATKLDSDISMIDSESLITNDNEKRLSDSGLKPPSVLSSIPTDSPMINDKDGISKTTSYRTLDRLDSLTGVSLNLHIKGENSMSGPTTLDSLECDAQENGYAEESGESEIIASDDFVFQGSATDPSTLSRKKKD